MINSYMDCSGRCKFEITGTVIDHFSQSYKSHILVSHANITTFFFFFLKMVLNLITSLVSFDVNFHFYKENKDILKNFFLAAL